MTKISLLMGLAFLALIYPKATNNVTVDNTAVYKGNDQWEWTIFVKASPDILNSIEYVQYTLHPTFYDPVQKVYNTKDPDHPFGLTRTGWGVFEVPVKVVFKTGEQLNLRYMLRFHEASQDSKCRAAFAVGERHYKRIDDVVIKAEIYVYVGEIHRGTTKPFYVAVFNGDQPLWRTEGDMRQADFDKRMKGIAEDHRWISKLRNVGDSVAFQDAGRPFHLEFVSVAPSQNDSRRVELRVCEY